MGAPLTPLYLRESFECSFLTAYPSDYGYNLYDLTFIQIVVRARVRVYARYVLGTTVIKIKKL